ncbi:MAG: FIST C-terminal domain-containing protein [Elainella sp. Prado103]|jgi:hypothetical protein|nr:FIST C-terminal domain-containing protein [Elainella sp. Prado103]
MFKVAIGHSVDPDTESAVQEVLAQCQQSLEGNIPQAGIVFAAIDFDHPLLLQQITTAWPEIELIGCTTDGELSSVHEFQQDSLVLMLFSSDCVTLRAGVGQAVSQDPLTAAQQAVEIARSSSDAIPCLCIALPESLTVSSPRVVESLQQVLGSDFPIYGGFAGDRTEFQRTYQFFGTEVFSDALPILMLYGNLRFSHGVSHGWTPIGRKGTLTQVVGNRIYEIDHQPALNFYDYYMPGLLPSTEFPLAIFEDDLDRFYLRVAIGYDRPTGALQALVDWPQSGTVQIAQASQDAILQGAWDSFQQALASYPGEQPEAALVFTCCVRRNLLGTRTKQEYRLIQQQMADLPIAGFYTYGEIAPLAVGSPARSHHATFVTLLLGTQ